MTSGTTELTSTAGALTTANLTTSGTTQLTANTGLTTANITALGSNLALTSQTGPIAVGNLNTSSSTGGNISATAATTITAGTIDTSGTAGAGGNVTLDPNGTVVVTSINSQGATAGGTVNILANSLGQFVRITGSFTASDSSIASISTIGGTSTGAITINHGGGANTQFVVGDATVNGSAADLTTGQTAILVEEGFLGTYIQENIQLIALNASGGIVPFISSTGGSGRGVLSEQELARLAESSPSLAGNIGDLESQFSNEFSIFGVQPDRQLLMPDVPDFLAKANEATGQTFAAVYLYFESPDAPDSQNPDDVLRSTNILPPESPLDVVTMVAVTAEQVGQKVSLPTSERRVIEPWIRELRNDIQVPALGDRYRSYASNLYESLIRPIVASLPSDVENLMFVLGNGLRQVPLAALYDAQSEEFLIEQYGITLVPSLSYIDDTSVDKPFSLANVDAFAMGKSQFPEDPKLVPLLGVPTELELIQKTRPTTLILDAALPLANPSPTTEVLEAEFTQQSLFDFREDSPIVHLATHANFGESPGSGGGEQTRAGAAYSSFIQFDQQLPITETKTLDLDRPIVELFTLSACETAVGDREAELGFAGLSLQAGAESALASLWKVGDAGTPVFMGEFYQQLNQPAHLTRATALRQAQLALLRGKVTIQDGVITLSDGTTSSVADESFQTALRSSGPGVATGAGDLTHPFYWAAFTLIGSPW